MRNNWLLLFAVFAVTLMPLYASAEIKEGSFELSPFAGGLFHDGEENINSTIVIGGRAGYNFTPNIGVEGTVDVSHNNVRHWWNLFSNELKFGIPDYSVVIIQYHADAIYHFMPYQRFVPFVVAGVGGAYFRPNETQNKHELLADVGVGFKYWLTDVTAFRMDVRNVTYVNVFKQNPEITVGLVLALGGKGKPEAPAPPPGTGKD
ncbi:MAG: outer membrane beta-barrel domain-containing protein [Dissulfurispiraceae bacterium]